MWITLTCGAHVGPMLTQPPLEGPSVYLFLSPPLENPQISLAIHATTQTDLPPSLGQRPAPARGVHLRRPYPSQALKPGIRSPCDLGGVTRGRSLPSRTTIAGAGGAEGGRGQDGGRSA
uniref:Uncharacterized protein n=1 Tax=Oryza nivara TaxID=4536 RepID=A0A0E0IKR8_ORYNI